VAKSANDLRGQDGPGDRSGSRDWFELARKDGEGFASSAKASWSSPATGPQTRESVASRLAQDAIGLKGSEVVSEPADPKAFGLEDAPRDPAPL
jgi:hypothetical protein